MNRLDKVKDSIKENYKYARCGLYFTRNITGDKMRNIYHEDGITIDICLFWAYFEVFGLNKDEQKELLKFYEGLRNEAD